LDEVSKQHKTIAWNQPLLELLESTRLLYTMTRFIQYSVQKVIIGKSKERKSSVGESASGIESRKSQLVAGKRILFLGIPGLRICLGSDHHLACCNGHAELFVTDS
jgi:hypothetical protein